MAKIKITEEKIKEIIKLDKKGYSRQEISNLMNVSKMSIYTILRRAGTTKTRQQYLLTYEERKKIAQDYFINNVTQQEIITKYNITSGLFSSIRAQFGSSFPKKQRGTTNGQADKVRTLLSQNLSQSEIAKIVGLSRQRVSAIVKKLK